jgi:WD40 repeat protein
VWDATTGREIAVLTGHELGVESVAWSPDGTRLATASRDNTGHIFTVFHNDERNLIDCALGQIPRISEEVRRLAWPVGKGQGTGRLHQEINNTSYVERWQRSGIACDKLMEPRPIDEAAKAYWLQYQ